MQANRLEERVANLERKVRINRGIQGAVGLGMLLYLTSSLSAPTQDSARPRRLELVDSDGRTRLVLEADPAPRLRMLSPSGQEQVLLGIGGEGSPFGIREGPNLTLNTGSTHIWMFVKPAPTSEGLEERHRVESAMLQMGSGRIVEGQIQQKMLTTGIFPNKASLMITTHDPEDPAASLYDPGVKLLIDETGKVTTKLGK